MATQGTLSSALFAKTSEIHTKDVRVIEQIGTGLVEAIETGSINDPRLLKLLSSYLNPILEQNIDVLVLGCTHYPLLHPLLDKVLPDHVQIIDSAEAVARQTQRVLEKNQLQTDHKEKGEIRYFSSAKHSTLNRFISKSEKVNFFSTDQI